jgi:hypothetical protein
MKKLLAFVLVSAVVIGTVAADPIGLSVYVDGFWFGDVLQEDYKLSGDGGAASFDVLGVKYAKSFGALGLATALDFTLPLATDPVYTLPRWTLKGTYGLDIAQNSKLTFSLYNKLYLKTTGGEDSKYAATGDDGDGIQDRIGPGVKFTQTLGFGSIYAIAEIDFLIHTATDADIDILASGDDDGIKVGVDTDFGLYGYLQPILWFSVNGETPDDILRNFNVRIGYKTGNIDGRVTVTIPTVEDGIDHEGITIRPRFTYNNIIPGLTAYADARILGVGAKSEDDGGRKIGLNPGIGVIYAF